MVFSLIYFLIILSLLSYVIYKKNHSNTIQPLSDYTYLFSFWIKCIVGSFFVYYYLKINFDPNEPSDVYRFFQEGKDLNNIFYQSPKTYFQLLFKSNVDHISCRVYFENSFLWLNNGTSFINDTHNLIRLQSLFHFISFNNIYIHVLIINFISIFGFIKLFKTIQYYSNFKPIYLFTILLLSPSIIFWTSGILKESFLFTGIGFLIYGILYPNPFKKKLINFFIGLVLLILFKPYLLFALLILTPLILIYKYIFKNKFGASILSYLLICIISIILLQNTFQTLTSKISRKQFDMINLGEGGIHVYGPNCYYYFTPDNYKNLSIDEKEIQIKQNTIAYKLDVLLQNNPEEIKIAHSLKKYPIHIVMPGSTSFFNVTRINNSKLQLIKNIPEAIANAFLRPLPNEKFNWMSLPFQIEIIFSLLLLSYILYKRQSIDSQKQFIVLYLTLFSLLLLLLIGWTTPISGAIIRFRFPVQIALIFIIAILHNKKDKQLNVNE